MKNKKDSEKWHKSNCDNIEHSFEFSSEGAVPPDYWENYWKFKAKDYKENYDSQVEITRWLISGKTIDEYWEFERSKFPQFKSL